MQQGDIEDGSLTPLEHRNLSTVVEEVGPSFNTSLALLDLSQELNTTTATTQDDDEEEDNQRGPQNLADDSDEIDDSTNNNDGYDGGSSNADIEDCSSHGRTVRFARETGGDNNRHNHPLRSSSNGLVRTQGRFNIKVEQPAPRVSQGQHVTIRHTDTSGAMDEKSRRRQRWKKSFSNLFPKGSGESDEEDEDLKISMHGRLMVQPSRRVLKNVSSSSHPAEDKEDEEERKRAETQYRLTTVKKNTRTKTTIPGMYEDIATGDVADCCFCCSVNTDRFMSAFLHWSFRASFPALFGVISIVWLALTFIFAAVIHAINVVSPHCIGGPDYGNASAPFLDAYAISWTTFSTVGYGLVYPATSKDHTPIHECTLISVVATLEAFVGILFSSLCAALIFAKVARVQSFAQVSFSHPMVIRYGTGLTTQEDDDDDEEGMSKRDWDAKKQKDPLGLRIPCPILEFRIVNRMNSLPGGEIIDASLNMVAVIDIDQSDPALVAQNRRRRKGKKKRVSNRNHKPTSLRFQQRDFRTEPPLREEEPTLPEQEVAAEETEIPPSPQSPPSPPASPPPPPESTIPSVPKPEALRYRHRSAVPCDAPVPHRGPAPSIGKQRRKSVIKTSLEQQQGIQGQPRKMDPRLAARYRAQHPSMAGEDHGHAPGRSLAASSIASSILQMPKRFAKGRAKRAFSNGNSVLYNPSLNRVSMRNTNIQQFEEDPSGKIINKKMLSKLEVESPDHPFFRRIWLVRHTLDVNSLLLKPHVRDLLRRNQGYWPKELNNYESIRASLEFDQILVSLSGTSNADANSVYAQYVYHMVDVNVGYRFVNALYRDPDRGTLKVDKNLINDVMEQAGGGGEPLHELATPDLENIMVL